jgi:oxaloacetate decarboxylase alpha subunit
MGKIKITDTSLRDGHQSLWATRMATDDMLPVLAALDDIGYHSLEMWGGATFDVCIRYLNEDPWERLRTIREIVKKTKLQMLLRGQSLVGYTHYPDDIAYKFVEKAAENGIDIFRVFDALNDIRNLEVPIKAVKRTGKHVQACVVYTISPVHSNQQFLETALRLKDMGADSICIKDMAGLLAPYASFELVSLFKQNLGLPVQLHTHYYGGLAIATLIKAAEAGVDMIDTASVPMAFGSSQPPVETVVRVLQESEWDTGLDLHKLFEIANHFEQIRKHKGFERGVTRITDMQVFEHQIPGGMITNLYSQLEEQKAADRIDEVLAEIPKVREDLGYPPLVTPTSQLIVIQAVANILARERYKLCSREVKQYARGFYGKPPAPLREEVLKKIVGEEEIISVRPADLLEPGWEKAVQETARWSESEEDALTYALFPQPAIKFFEYRRDMGLEDIPQIQTTDEVAAGMAVEEKIAAAPPRPAPARIKKRLAVEGDEDMNIDDIRELMLMLDQSSIVEMEVEKDGFRVMLKKPGAQQGSPAPAAAPREAAPAPVYAEPAAAEIPENLVEVVAPMVGTFYAAPSPDASPYVRVGEQVKPGQTLCIVEAMKLMNEIKSEVSGVIAGILVENGEPVEYGQIMFVIEED